MSQLTIMIIVNCGKKPGSELTFKLCIIIIVLLLL